MTRHFSTRPLQFYLTAPSPCPYLPGRQERKVFAELCAVDGAALNDALTHAGFRRSQGIIYRPSCETCEACLSARVVVSGYRPGRSHRRIWSRNADLVHTMHTPEPKPEHFRLLRRYLDARHPEGGMAGMAYDDYILMVADTPAMTRVSEYRTPDGRLIAAMLVDYLSDGLSLVYSYFDPDDSRRSLGSFMIMDQIARARAMGAAYVYLGYWVPRSAKMDYKARFQPLEVLQRGGWRRTTVLLAQSGVVRPPRGLPLGTRRVPPVHQPKRLK